MNTLCSVVSVGHAGGILVADDRLAELVCRFGSASVILFVEDVDDVAEREREVVDAGDRVAERPLQLVGRQARAAARRVCSIHGGPDLVDVALNLREKLTSLIELLIEHDAFSPYVAGPGVAAPGVPAMTVAETPDVPSTGVGVSGAEAGPSPRPASASPEDRES